MDKTIKNTTYENNEYEQDIFCRTVALIGEKNFGKLTKSCVVVLGLGGVGSACVSALARMGVGTLVLLDYDVIEPSNINRQLIAFNSNVGKTKVEACCEMIKNVNPGANIISECKRLDEGSVIDFICKISSEFSNEIYVVDALDTVSVKVALAKHCEDNNIKLVSCMGTAQKLYPEMLAFADIYETNNCGLCKTVRKKCRKSGVESLKVLYSREITPELSDKSVLGSCSFVPPIAGMMIAGYVCRDICSI